MDRRGGLRCRPHGSGGHGRWLGRGDGGRGGEGDRRSEAGADPRASRSRGKARACRVANSRIRRRTGGRGTRPPHPGRTGKVLVSQPRLSRPLRLSVHRRGEGQAQGGHSRRLRKSPRQRFRHRNRGGPHGDRPHCGPASEGNPALSARPRVVRGRVLTFTDDPSEAGSSARIYLADGAILVENGRIERVGEALDILAGAPQAAIVDEYSGCLIMPGFIDAHIHYPQTQVIGSYGAQLLDWLHNYTFIEEQKFADPGHCARIAEFFLEELIRCGTTTAMVYCTVHPQSVDAFFAASERRGARMIAGKTMMDRDAPDALRDTAQRSYDESKALIERWRGRGRLDYAVTPRFAVTSSEEQLEVAGALARECPGVYVQTHVDENKAEIALVRRRFPQAQNYLDVYDRAGLLGPRSVFGHCIHLKESEVAALDRKS